MKSVYAITFASMLLAVPLAMGADPCGYEPEGIAHPNKPGHYLYVAPTQPDKAADWSPTKIGQWAESNGWAGLQTTICKVNGVRRYSPDTYVGVLP